MARLKSSKGKRSEESETPTFSNPAPIKMQTSESSYFVKIIVDPSTQNHKLRIPEKYVKNYGKQLVNDYVKLIVADGRVWKVELFKESGRVWLTNGWERVVRSYSLSYGNFLMFRYDEGYSDDGFHVTIFGMTCCEIEYDQVFHNHIKAQEVIEISSQNEETIMDPDGDYDCVISSEEAPAIDDKTNIMQSLEAFQSQKPHFKVAMHRSYVSKPYRLTIPANYVRMHFKDTKEIELIFKGPDGRSYIIWTNVCKVTNRATRTTGYGWKRFVRGNQLNVGDACVFELVNHRSNTYKVTIFRADQ